MNKFLEESKMIQEKATSGPWCNWYGSPRADISWEKYKKQCGLTSSLSSGNPYPLCKGDDDIDFIAESRTRWPKETKALGLALKLLERSCDCETLGYMGSSGPCGICLSVKEINEILK